MEAKKYRKLITITKMVSRLTERENKLVVTSREMEGEIAI